MENAILQIRSSCPACGGTSLRSLARDSFSAPQVSEYLSRHYGGRADLHMLTGCEYELLRCKNCGLGFQRGVPGKELLLEVYDKWIPATEFDRLRSSYSMRDYDYLAHQVQFLLRYFRLAPCKLKVFDFGLGWAEWASMAQAFGCNVFGTDLSPTRIDNAIRLGIGIVSWEDIPRHGFHYINTEQVFEHLVSPRETLERLASALLPGGLLKFSVPDARKSLSKLEAGETFGSLSDREKMSVHPLEHINSFTYGSIMRLAELAGLKALRPGMRRLLNSSTDMLSPRAAARAVARAAFRHWYPKSTFVYLIKPLHQ